MKLLLLKDSKHDTFHVNEEHLKKIRSVNKEIEIFSGTNGHAIDAHIIAGFPWSLAEVFPRARSVQWLHSFSAGVDALLVPEIVRSNVVVSNSSGVHATPIAEHIIAFMLMFTKKFYASFSAQQKKVWDRREDLEELHAKTVLIVGFGRIGKEAGRLAECFGARVIGIDKDDGAAKLHQGLALADFVVLALPHTKDTHHMFNRELFQKMKPSSVLINIGRGGVVNEAELIDVLEKNIIGGAALDVTEIEPLPSSSPLWGMENVIITPHHSGVSSKYMDRAIDRFCLNLTAFLEHKPLPNLVDKQLGY
jgi:phosphoglycerate dehydrogenase-like enzyme